MTQFKNAYSFMCRLRWALTFLYGLWTPGIFAEPYPVRPIRLVVPFAPGGGTEPIARLISQKLTLSMGQQWVVDNRPGAGTTMGMEVVAKAAADGYTLLLGSVANAISATLYQRLSFDPMRDFSPITLLSTTPGLLAVHPSLNVDTVKALIGLAKARPGQLAYSSAGSGTPTHLAAEFFSYLTEVRLIHIPYKGGGPSVIALLSGEAHLSFASLPSVLPAIRSGKLKALAVTTAKRAAVLPQVPTIIESGVLGYEAETWYGLAAPAHLPNDKVIRLNREVHSVLEQEEAQKFLDSVGMQLRLSTSEQYVKFTQSEIQKWHKVISFTHMRAD